MNELDCYCSLLFDEISLHFGLQYDSVKQKICGLEDFGHLGWSNWKQVIAYYFMTDTISKINLKNIIVQIISHHKKIGLTVFSTVYDQEPTNFAAIDQLCKEYSDKSEKETFCIMINPLRGSVSYMIHQTFFSFSSILRPFSARSLSNKLLHHH